MTNLRLSEKVAIVTGAGSGIGRATALLFVREGARVVAASNQPEDHPALEEEARKLPGELLAIEADVTRDEDARRLTETAIERFGRLDILVNNAGIVGYAKVHEETEEQWNRMMDVNLRGVFLCSKHAVPQMIRRQRGSIVNVSSINGLRGNHALAAYCASKGGVRSLTHAMAMDYGPEGIRVNCVCPGTIEQTRQVDQSRAAADDVDAFNRYLLDKHPLGKFGKPDDVAHAILFLAGDEAAFITGASLPVDGGRSVR